MKEDKGDRTGRKLCELGMELGRFISNRIPSKVEKTCNKEAQGGRRSAMREYFSNLDKEPRVILEEIGRSKKESDWRICGRMEVEDEVPGTAGRSD